jgi:hypothetical protein
MAKAAYYHQNKYRFAMRYVRRTGYHDFDLSAAEVDDILGVGLGLGVVQHVAPPRWTPTAELGTIYGAVAANECSMIGLPAGTIVSLDLEEVESTVLPKDVIDFCNNWWEAVNVATFDPMLYVGYRPGLNRNQLFQNLRFKRYWAAYNLNLDMYPATRGVQLRQLSARHLDRFVGVETEESFDMDRVLVDALGGTPQFLFARD